jgi:demethylmenaquinone methyltransferase/2-methoxy-6-polyprenyl-1,4-benzoquinol methylase
MRNLRRAYYDKFSRFYDRFVALHSRDPQGMARKFLADQAAVQSGGSVLDVCTGTGTLLSHLQEKVGRDGLVVGVDFSRGMLNMAYAKTRSLPNVHLVEADAGRLPFRTETFDAVTCSHAFYELKGETRDGVLQEVLRILRPKGTFLMMEHDVPSRPIVRALFYLRLTIIGAGRAITFLRHEREALESYFPSVEKTLPPAGRSKILICRKLRSQ